MTTSSPDTDLGLLRGAAAAAAPAARLDVRPPTPGADSADGFGGGRLRLQGSLSRSLPPPNARVNRPNPSNTGGGG